MGGTGFILADQLARDLHSRTAVLINGVLKVILELVIALDGKRVLGGVDADRSEPLGVDIESARRLTDRFAENLLAFCRAAN